MSLFSKKVKRLFIAEKPLVAKTVVEALGGDVKKDRKGKYWQVGNDVVVNFFGHVMELQEPHEYDPKFAKWNLDDLPIIHTPWKLKVKEDGDIPALVAMVADFLKKVPEVVHVGDWDEEGQLLVDEVLDHYNYPGNVLRAQITNDNIDEARKALENLEPNSKYRGWSNMALARSVADQMYGVNLSRLFNLTAQNAGYQGPRLNVGRVMTPILGLVVSRDLLRLSHEKVFYYDVVATFDFVGRQVGLGYRPTEDDPRDDKGRLSLETAAKSIAEATQGQNAKVEQLNSKVKKENAPLPYSILELQADAATKFKLSAEETLEITQSLRDKHKCITYNRSDCRYLDDSHFEAAPKVIQGLAGQPNWPLAELAKGADTSIKSRAFNSAKTTAHHGIIPDSPVDPDKLSEKERQVYELVVSAYLAQFYPTKETQTTEIVVECAGRIFAGKHSLITSKGWTVVYQEPEEEGDDETKDTCPLDGLDNATGQCIEALSKSKATKPPKAYTEASLLKDLKQVSKYAEEPIKSLLLERDKEKSDDEKGGIGTPATRDKMLAKIIENGWATRSENLVWESTEAGRNYYDMLPPEIRGVDMTALWFEEQLDIQDGKKTVEEFVSGVADFIRDEVKRIAEHGLNLEIVRHDCNIDDCDGHMRRLPGKDDFFWSCSNYDDGNGCRNTMPDRNGKPSTRKARGSGRSGRSGRRSSSRRRSA